MKFFHTINSYLDEHPLLFYILLFSPLSFLFINWEWVFTAPAMIDSYMSLGLKYHYGENQFLEHYYKSSRVPEIAPLFYLHKIIGHESATVMTVLGGLLLLGIGYYTLIKRLFSRKAALLLLPVIVFFPHLVGYGSGGGDYHNAPAMIYLIFGLICWVTAHQEEKPGYWPFFAGVLLISAVTVNVVLLNLLPLFYICVYGLNVSVTKMKKTILHIFLGMGSGFLFWALVNVANGRRFWYFSELYYLLFGFLKDPSKQLPWWKPLSSFFFLDVNDGSYTSFFIAAFVASFFCLILRKKSTFSMSYIFFFSLWVFWQAMGHTALQPGYFAYALQLPAFLMIASWVTPALERIITPIKLLSLTFLFFLCLVFTQFIQYYYLWPNTTFFVLFQISIFLLCFLILIFSPRAYLFSFLIVLFPLGHTLVNTEHEARAFQPSCYYREDSQKALFRMAEKVMVYQDDPDKIFVYTWDKPIHEFPIKRCPYLKISTRDFAYAFYHMTGRYFQSSFPMPSTDELNEESFSRLKEGGILVVFPHQNGDFLSKLEAQARKLNHPLKLIETLNEKVDNMKINYHVYRLQ